MVKKILQKGRNIFTAPQSSILSAASVIMLMIVASRILGLVRQRALAHYFTAEKLSLFFAAFRLPDLVFEVLVFGTFASAFIPVFTKELKKNERDAWRLAAIIANIGLLIFIGVGFLLVGFSDDLYQLIAPGFGEIEREQIVALTKILFAAQGFFVISYVLTGVLESMRRFLVPALAPIFYNLGIILGTILLSSRLGLLAPAVGVFIGASLHFLIQLPLAMKLGFRFIPKIEITPSVKKIGRLAFPRVIEVSFLQVLKMAELYFASLISTASYTYYTFGNTLQLLPLGLFGISISKAALPTLSALSDSKKEFGRVLWKSLREMVFLTAPVATILIVLRIPIVRLVYGTDIFTWESTVQTGYVLSAFALGVVFQAASALLSRAFYALQDTKTPVIVSIITTLIIVFLDFVFIRKFTYGVWGLAVAFSIGSSIQALTLFYLVNKRLNGKFSFSYFSPFVKYILAAFGSGFVMYVLLKIFDKSVWVKKLSFLGKIESSKYLAFENFVLDTRFTINLLVLTIAVSLVGLFIYLGLSVLLKTKEVYTFYNLAKRIIVKRKVGTLPSEDQEPVTPTPTDIT